jgi:type II secretory pathway component PulC
MNTMRTILFASALASGLSATALLAETDTVPSIQTAGARSIHVVSQERYQRLSDRDLLRAQVDVEPVMRDGDIYGYRIAYLRDGGDLAALGLAHDDVIVAVNGGPVDPPGPFYQAMDYLDPPFLGSVSFEVERKGTRRLVTYVVD